MGDLVISDERILELLRRARQLVDEADVPTELRGVAFDRLLGALLDQTFVALVRTKTDPAVPSGKSTGALEQPGRGTLERIVERLGIPDEVVRRVYADVEGILQVIVPPSRLAASRRASMRELSLLYVVGRQTGGWDKTSTSLVETRSACEAYGPRFFDGNNFINSLNDLGDSIRRTGQGKDVGLILTPTGIDAGRETVVRLGGSSSN